jgi:hypothetical protein
LLLGYFNRCKAISREAGVKLPPPTQSSRQLASKALPPAQLLLRLSPRHQAVYK